MKELAKHGKEPGKNMTKLLEEDMKLDKKEAKDQVKSNKK